MNVLTEGTHIGRHPNPNQGTGCPLDLLNFSRRYDNDYLVSFYAFPQLLLGSVRLTLVNMRGKFPYYQSFSYRASKLWAEDSLQRIYYSLIITNIQHYQIARFIEVG
jgi:hypothetical protein